MCAARRCAGFRSLVHSPLVPQGFDFETIVLDNLGKLGRVYREVEITPSTSRTEWVSKYRTVLESPAPLSAV
jgi:hypothetical protein